MAKKVYDVVATVGEYTDRFGETKRRYHNCGAVFESDKGMSIKLNSLPVGPEWNGWLSLYEPREENTRENAPRQSAPRTQSAAPARGAPPDDFDDKIPF